MNVPTIAAPMYPEFSLACAQPLHHVPASPPPSAADAAAWHLPQLAPISPMISMSEMLNASKILIVVRVMLSSDIVFRLTNNMRSACSRLAASLSPALFSVLFSVSTPLRDRLTGTTSFVAGHASAVLSSVEDAAPCLFTDRASPVLEGDLLGSKILHEWSANPVYE